MVLTEGAIPFKTATGAARLREGLCEEVDIGTGVGPVIVSPIEYERGDVVVLSPVDESFGEIPLHVESKVPYSRIGEDGAPTAPTRKGTSKIARCVTACLWVAASAKATMPPM